MTVAVLILLIANHCRVISLRNDKDEEQDCVSPTKTDTEPNIKDAGRGKAQSSLKGIVSGRQKAASVQSTPISVDKKYSSEPGSKDFADRIAALSNNWMSIKHTDLEPIKEYIPGDQKSSPILVKDKKVEVMHSKKRLMATAKEGTQRSKPVIAKKDPVSTSMTSRGGVPSRGKNFDLVKTFEELDQIKKKVHSTASSTNLNAKRATALSEARNTVGSTSKNSADHNSDEMEEDSSHLDDDSNARQTARLNTLASRRAQHLARKASDGQAATNKRGNLVKYKRMMDDIEMTFGQAMKKVQDFQRDTGSHLRMNEFNKEYKKLIDSIKDAVKKAS